MKTKPYQQRAIETGLKLVQNNVTKLEDALDIHPFPKYKHSEKYLKTLEI